MNAPARFWILTWVVVYAILIWAAAGLRFPLRGDELHFWPTSLLFSHYTIPPLGLLRGYKELNTPLPFLIFGALERLFHGGIFVGRLFNVIVSFGVITLMLLEGKEQRSRANLAVAGVVLFPYFIGLSLQLYTDIIATFAVLAGVWLYVRGKHVGAAIAFALAIASRQYMVAFPGAIVVWEFWKSPRSWSVAPSRWMAPALAAATLGAWYLFFHGPAPRPGLESQGIPSNRLTDLAPSHLISLLSMVGLFYVCPETLMFREWRGAHVSARRAIFGVIAMMAASFFFPPLGSTRYGPWFKYLGIVDHGLGRFLPDDFRIALYALLAFLAVLRFAPTTLPGLFVWSNGVILMSGQIMWEKYAMPLLVVLWYLKARGEDQKLTEQTGAIALSAPKHRLALFAERSS